ncbi:glycosyltransferase, partial [Streptococcus agalactiae]|nr:glycosyltransferase [Streptococcus agalactiae]MCD0112456.1 glycosyltransferase [Streptococcus agalactiae]
MKYLAGIVTFNPNIERLDQNIRAIYPQVSHIYIVDNGSKNKEEISQLVADYNEEGHLTVDYLTENKGIAYALNCIGQFAVAQEFDWFLTLDQDSVVLGDLIDNYENYLHLPKIGMLSCLYQDMNREDLVMQEFDYKEIEECITSAALMKTSVFEETSGFAEEMFIDFVDSEMNYRLSEMGYKTYQVNFIGLLHEIGHSSRVKKFGHVFHVLNHSSFRKYYMIRNAIYI